ncbi:1228_t:CDS:2, partial [Diversispora eburnea]
MTKDRNIESGINKENDREDESAVGPNIDNQVLEASSFSSRVFIHDYPKNPRIEAQYKSRGRTYISYYNIIALGTYPITPKLTQKPNCSNVPQYPIPDNYIVETEIAERGVKCETKYISNSKINYTVTWKEGRAEWSVN